MRPTQPARRRRNPNAMTWPEGSMEAYMAQVYDRLHPDDPDGPGPGMDEPVAPGPANRPFVLRPVQKPDLAPFYRRPPEAAPPTVPAESAPLEIDSDGRLRETAPGALRRWLSQAPQFGFTATQRLLEQLLPKRPQEPLVPGIRGTE